VTAELIQPDINAAKETAREVLSAEHRIKTFNREGAKEFYSAMAFAGVLLASSQRDPSAPIAIGTLSVEVRKDHRGWAAEIIKQALSGDKAARVALRDFVSMQLRDGKPLPPNLRDYVLEMLGDEPRPSRRGVSSNANFGRDYYIAMAVACVKEHGFERKRNRATTSGHSACSIVTDVLAEMGFHMSEANVDRISDKYANEM
jgi:hypothetical protein